MPEKHLKTLKEISTLSPNDTRLCFDLEADKDHLTNETLALLATIVPDLECLDINQEYTEEEKYSIDFSLHSFPKLTSLCTNCVPLTTLVLPEQNYPVLEALDIQNTGPWDAARFSLRLPRLERLTLQFVHVI